ncbi:hypothetical protein ES707_10432 [subsurface metagenome]
MLYMGHINFRFNREGLSGLVNLMIKNLFLVYYKRVDESNEIHINL